VLADARDDNMQSRLNRKTKYREGFRPFAPMIKAESGKDYFDNFTESPYMLNTFYLKNNYRNKLENSNKDDIFKRVRERRSIIPAVTHIDYSARTQSVDKKRNPFIYSIIENFEKITGTPIIINTSFNVRGEPIVASSEDAIECFLNTDIDILVLENYIINKKENVDIKSKRKSALKND
jgi:carbamoyltransferase